MKDTIMNKEVQQEQLKEITLDELLEVLENLQDDYFIVLVPIGGDMNAK